MKSPAEIHAEVVRQAQRLAYDRFDEIRRHVQETCHGTLDGRLPAETIRGCAS